MPRSWHVAIGPGDLTAVWVPDEGSEALRDLVRAREAAKQDQTRARHRLSKFLLRSGQRPPTGVKPWTRPYLIWVAQLRFTQIAQESTRQDYLHEVEHMRGRVERLEQAIMEVVKLASPALQQVINDLQALRGIAARSTNQAYADDDVAASRFDSSRQFAPWQTTRKCAVHRVSDASDAAPRGEGRLKHVAIVPVHPNCLQLLCGLETKRAAPIDIEQIVEKGWQVKVGDVPPFYGSIEADHCNGATITDR